MTFDAMVDRLLSMFDIDQPTAVSWLNERQKRMVGEAEFRLAETSFGNTAAGVSDYTLPDSVENIAFLQVGTDTDPYVRASARQIANLRTGRDRLDGGAVGAFAMYADATGAEKVRLWPTPTSVLPITGWTSIDPVDMTYAGGFTPIIPSHLHTHLLDGGIADGYENDGRWDLAGNHEARYETGIVKLRRYKNARLDAGPAGQIQRGW